MRRFRAGALILLMHAGASTLSAQSSDNIARWRDDVQAMALDLEAATGIPRERARSLAYQSVSEAYRYGVPIPLVFGILMQETSRLDTRAVSVAGAQGLMQIMPNIWKPVLGPHFGNDLFDEATNIRYGVWIIAHYLHRSSGDWERAVERYSGGARQYARRVSQHVETRAPHVCPERSFHACGAVPARRVFGP